MIKVGWGMICKAFSKGGWIHKPTGKVYTLLELEKVNMSGESKMVPRESDYNDTGVECDNVADHYIRVPQLNETSEYSDFIMNGYLSDELMAKYNISFDECKDYEMWTYFDTYPISIEARRSLCTSDELKFIDKFYNMKHDWHCTEDPLQYDFWNFVHRRFVKLAKRWCSENGVEFPANAD